MFGLLNVNKPPGVTSRDVVNHVQRLVRPAKAGHAGTLDPLATGVLVVCVGPATRLIQFVQRMPKRYIGTFLLGRSSETDDVEGRIVELENPPRPTREQLESVLPELTGEIDQRPPAYSALKVGGKRAYDLARRGEDVQLASRKVQIHGLRIVAYEYPDLVLGVHCGSGTYIRSIGRDLASLFGTAAVMSALERKAVGEFTVQQAIPLDQLTAESISDVLQPATRAVGELPAVQLSAEEVARVANGMFIENRRHLEHAEIAGIGLDGQLACVLTPRDGDRLGPSLCFVRQPQ